MDVQLQIKTTNLRMSLQVKQLHRYQYKIRKLELAMGLKVNELFF